VGAGLGAAAEALLVGYDLVAARDADAVVVVAAEHVGHVVRDLWGAAGWPVPSHGAVAIVLAPAESETVGLDRNGILQGHARIEAALGACGRERPGFRGLLAALAAGTAV
jgi:hypothetical protein